jgi:hypothetical protein
MLIMSELISLKLEKDEKYSETHYCCAFIPKTKLLHCKKGRISEDLLNFITSHKFQLSREIQRIRTRASRVDAAGYSGSDTTRDVNDRTVF